MALEPVQSLDGLIDLFAAVLENPAAADDIECVLDGVARLCAENPDDFGRRTSPLLARASALSAQHFNSYTIQGRLCDLARAWIAGVKIHKTLAESSQWGLFGHRINDLIAKVSKPQATTLFSMPTHRGGWIDPLVLARRVRSNPAESIKSSEADGALALLRLAPDNRGAALEELGGMEGEFASALRYALGSEQETIGPTASWWVSAVRARAPFADDPALEDRHPGLGPDAGLAARYSFRPGRHSGPRSWLRTEWEIIERSPSLPPAPLPVARIIREPTPYGDVAVTSVVDILEPIPVLLQRMRTDYWSTRAYLHWAATLWPLARESFFAAGAREVAGHTGVPTQAQANRAYLLPLFDPDVPMKPMALHLLALALSARQADESGLAVDVLIAAIDDGRVSGEELGAVMRSLAPSGLVRPLRWAKTIADVARISPLHSRVSATILQWLLQDDVCPFRRDHNALLELLKELLIAGGEAVTCPATRDHLSRVPTGGRTESLSRDLLAMKPSDDHPAHQAAALRALAGRIERAERWMRWRSASAGCHASPQDQERATQCHRRPMRAAGQAAIITQPP